VDSAPVDGAPGFATGVVLATLAGFAIASPLGIDPAIVAAVGALVLAVPALAAGRTSPVALVRAANPAFLLFVLALAVIVASAQAHGLGDAVAQVLPNGGGLLALLGVAALAALLANLVNNLPAILIVLPVLAVGAHGPGPVLAALIGVNVGPNLTYTGSLATLLWRRHLRGRDAEPEIGEFLRLGLATVPLALVAASVALWLSLQL
jgi:arsenical pump membrane protein